MRVASTSTAGGGGARFDVVEGQLRNVQAVLRDAEWTLCVLSEALVELGGTQALAGIAAYAGRKLATVHAAALRAQTQATDTESKKPAMQVMRTPGQIEAAQPWAPCR